MAVFGGATLVVPMLVRILSSSVYFPFSATILHYSLFFLKKTRTPLERSVVVVEAILYSFMFWFAMLVLTRSVLDYGFGPAESHDAFDDELFYVGDGIDTGVLDG